MYALAGKHFTSQRWHKFFAQNFYDLHSLFLFLFDFFCSRGWLSLALLTILRPLVHHFLEPLTRRVLSLVYTLGALVHGFDLAILEDLALSILLADTRVVLLRRSVHDALVSGCTCLWSS